MLMKILFQEEGSAPCQIEHALDAITKLGLPAPQVSTGRKGAFFWTRVEGEEKEMAVFHAIYMPWQTCKAILHYANS